MADHYISHLGIQKPSFGAGEKLHDQIEMLSRQDDFKNITDVLHMLGLGSSAGG